MTINLQDLMNKPGYGKHIPILQKAGKWDEWAGMPMKKWNVEIEIRGKDILAVDARSKDEAYEKAEKLAEKEYDDFEILEATECN